MFCKLTKLKLLSVYDVYEAQIAMRGCKIFNLRRHRDCTDYRNRMSPRLEFQDLHNVALTVMPDNDVVSRVGSPSFPSRFNRLEDKHLLCPEI